MIQLAEDFADYAVARLDKLDDQAREVKTSVIKTILSIETYKDPDLYRRVLDRHLSELLAAQTGHLLAAIRRAVSEERE